MWAESKIIFNGKLANRVREELALFPTLEERVEKDGLSFWIDQKRVVQVIGDELLIRCDKQMTDELSARTGASPYIRGKRTVKGWLLIDPCGTNRQADLEGWLIIALTAKAKTR